MKAFGECHAHIFMNGLDYPGAVRTHKDHPNETSIRMALRAYKDLHITFIRDGGDHFGVSKAAKQLAPEYGITYLTPVYGIFHEGNYGRVVGHSYSTMREYAALVHRAKEEGADFIKIMTSGIMTFQKDGELTGSLLPAEEVCEMVHIAHESGMKVMSHTNSAEGVLRAVHAGVDSVEHGNFQTGESLDAIAESETVWVPTVVTIKNLIGCGKFDDQVLETILEHASESIRYAYRKKALIACGSDAGAYMVPHAQGTLDEYHALQEITEFSSDLEERLLTAEKKIRSFVPQA